MAHTIKTLDEILAEMNTVSANTSAAATDIPTNNHAPTTPITHHHSKNPPSKQSSKAGAKKNISHSSENTALLKTFTTTQLPSQLTQTATESVYDNMDKKTRYLRWLAFYYLSRQELSQTQLRQKLLDKGCDPHSVAALIAEFAQKGYQSDERFAHTLIREAVRKNRGKRHILQHLYQAGIDLETLGSLDELIAQAGGSLTDDTLLSAEDAGTGKINWLALAVQARTKKYGNTLPKDLKEKARQLRFLQYRGFEMDICFEALTYCLEDLEN